MFFEGTEIFYSPVFFWEFIPKAGTVVHEAALTPAIGSGVIGFKQVGVVIP